MEFLAFARYTLYVEAQDQRTAEGFLGIFTADMFELRRILGNDIFQCLHPLLIVGHDAEPPRYNHTLVEGREL